MAFLDTLAVSEPLKRERCVPTSPRGQHADRSWDGLKRQAKCNRQQREVCAGGVDVGLQAGFMGHEVSWALTWNRVPPDALQSETHSDGDLLVRQRSS